MDGPVVCGIENANGGRVARVARDLAERYDLPLLYVHVIDGAGDAEETARLLGDAVAPGAGELAVESGHHPADRLVEVATERDASFLVVGNHGPHSSLLGSVSADVSRRAPCPVVVVPPRASLRTAEQPDEARLEAAFVVEGRSAR